MATKIVYLYILLFVAIVNHVTAQSRPYFQEQQYIYNNWNNKNGLTQNTVADILKDEEGYLWLATEEGVLRFDGTNFKVFNRENTPGVHSSTFYDLAKSKQGVWAAAVNTILYLNSDSIKTYDFRKHLKNSWISAISEDPQGVLWAGTNNGELFYIKNHRITRYHGLPAKNLKSIQTLNKNSDKLFLGTERGLFQINKDQSLAYVPGFETQNIRALEIDKYGSLWIGTKEDGLYHLKGKNTTQYTIKDGLNELFIRSLGISPGGDIWIGTSSSGIQILKDGIFEDLKDNGISNDGIKSIAFSEPDLIWLGTPASGLIQMKPARIQKFLKSDGLAGKVILPIYQHRKGEIWIGTAGQGINRIKDGKISHYTRRDGLANEIIISLYGTNERMLVGTVGGLNIFNLKSGKFEREFTIKDGLASNVVQSIFEDSSRRIWISTASGGVHLLENNKIKRLPLPVELLNAEMTSIFEDQKKNIWIGSSGAGFISINSENKITLYKNNLGVSSDMVYAFYEDKEGSLWLGTEAGLIPFQKKKIFDKSNGLKFNGIYRIIDDGRGYVWLSGNFGLQRISIHDLIKQKHNRSASPQISSRFFGTADGMANSETNGNISPAGWKMNDGNIWFPTVEGIAIVKPAKSESEQWLGPVKINSIQYDGSVKTQLKNIKIPPNVSTVSINYTSVNLVNPEETTYYYRLKGLSDTWEEAGNRNTAYFTLLNPGEYIFEVKAEQSGSWSKISKLSFNVIPVFYQTFWFRSVLGFLFLIMGFFVHKLYSSIHQESILTKMVDDRTNELMEKNEKFELINKQLDANRQQYQSLFFDNPYAVFSFDLAGNFISANKVTSELTGYPIEELLTMSFVPLIPKDSVNEVLEKLIKAGMGATQNYQTKIQTASGESLFVDVTNLPMTIDGKISGIYGVVKDITEEKLLTDQLALANERFRLANKATSDSIWDWDLKTNEIKRDENFLEVKLGYNPSSPDSIFESFRKLIHPEEVEKICNKLSKVLNDKSEEFWEEECRLLKPDNSYAIVYNKGYIIRDDEGQAIRMIGASQDITERKLEEQQLKLMESVITYTTDAVIISKVEGEELKIVFVNDAFTAMTGYILADIQCEKSPILRGPNTKSDQLSHFNRAINTGTAYQSEIINYKKNGDAFWVEVNMVPVKDKDGKCTYWVSIERDVTDRKNQMLSIEKQNDQLKEIAWTQSHVVRAPLSRIMGVVNLFEEGCVEETEIEEFLQYIKQSGNELDEIIKDIVKKSEIVEGNYIDEPEKRVRI
ncbi:MAG: PAS domain S-box protein [Daejeonella sp.]|uniref:PAS domain S-box protein n=1 Tax=Daejeonella sp. TaxID=2805397 RepID=UPI003C739FEB